MPIEEWTLLCQHLALRDGTKQTLQSMEVIFFLLYFANPVRQKIIYTNVAFFIEPFYSYISIAIHFCVSMLSSFFKYPQLVLKIRISV